MRFWIVLFVLGSFLEYLKLLEICDHFELVGDYFDS